MISITARNGTHRFQTAPLVPVTVPLNAVVWLTGQTASKYRHNREPNLRQKVDRSKKSHQTIADFSKVL
jgi:hypothetical protein